MLMITIQEEYIDNQDILYPNSHPSSVQVNSPNSFKKLFETYYQKTGSKFDKFIWCFTALGSENQIDLSDKSIIRALDTGVYINPHVYLLDTPDDIVLETSFYDWTDQVYYEENGKFDPPSLSYEQLWKNVFDTSALYRQAIIPHIKKEWILKYRNITNLLINNPRFEGYLSTDPRFNISSGLFDTVELQTPTFGK